MPIKSSERQNAEWIEERLTAEFDRISAQFDRPRAEWDHHGFKSVWDNVRTLRSQLERIARDQLRSQQRARSDTSSGAKRDQRYFRGVRARLRKWRSTRNALDALEKAPVLPLYDFETPTSAHLRQHVDVMDGALRMLHRVLNPLAQDSAADDHGCFPDIPMRASVFVAHCHAAYRICLAQRRAEPPRFLDVGCGIGMTLILAARFFEHLAGLEFDPGYVSAARDVLASAGLKDARVLEGDALEFEDYGDFDVIYFYRPMRDAKKLIRLEKQILQEAKKGTVLIAPYLEFGQRNDGRGCAGFGQYVFVAGLSSEEAADLQYETELIGTAIYDAVRDDVKKAGFLTRFLDVCRRNGIQFGAADPVGASVNPGAPPDRE